MEEKNQQPKQEQEISIREQTQKAIAACKTAEELVKLLDSAKDKSAVYIIIRDFVTPNQVKMIHAEPEQYKVYQDIKMRAKQSWDHDHTQAMMIDVDMACTKVYTILLNMIKALNDQISDLSVRLDVIDRRTDTTSEDQPRGDAEDGDVEGRTETDQPT